MKYLPQFIVALVIFGLPNVLSAQTTKLALLPNTAMTNYDYLPVAQLNQAHREMLSGRFEEALMTYDAALAWQPDWVPALTARATLLNRLGRSLEAQKDRQKAIRMNPEATAFFLSKGQLSLMPYLALYPHNYYANKYGIEEPVGKDGESPRDYFYNQYNSITEAADTSLAVRALQLKVSRDVLASRRSVEALPRGYTGAVRSMLLGNLSMLNHDYPAAINLYTEAMLTDGADWPELYYNRGLGYVLLNIYANGCADLREAAKSDYEPAKVMLDCLCNF